jgi:hypothetical protein
MPMTHASATQNTTKKTSNARNTIQSLQFPQRFTITLISLILLNESCHDQEKSEKKNLKFQQQVALSHETPKVSETTYRAQGHNFVWIKLVYTNRGGGLQWGELDLQQ